MKFLHVFVSCSLLGNMWKSGLNSIGQKIKNMAKIEYTSLFLFTFLVSFFMAFLALKLLYAVSEWFNFTPGSFCEQDYLLNLIILVVYMKRWPECARISKQKLMWPKIWSIFFLTFTVEDPSIEIIFSEKFFWGTRLFSEKRKICMQNLTKQWKQPPVVILQQSIFYNIFIRRLWLRAITKSDLGV